MSLYFLGIYIVIDVESFGNEVYKVENDILRNIKKGGINTFIPPFLVLCKAETRLGYCQFTFIRKT